MRLSKICFSIVWIMLLFISNASAAGPDESPNTTFRHGVQAFSKGEYEKAVRYFNAAQKGGLNTPALHYNLGVSYFKLKRYTEAQSEFERLTKEADLGPLSHYNLGLIALRRDDKSAAAQHFQTTYRTAKDKKLRMLAGAQLKDIPPPQKRRMWSGFFSFAAGYDDNVTLNVDDQVQVSDTKDEFVELIASATGQLTGTPKNGLQLGGTLFSLKYKDLDEFNFDSLRIGPEIDRRFGAWDTTLRGFVDWAFIDGDLFERIYSAEVKGSREIYPNLNLRLRYRLSLIDASSTYDYLSGTRHRINAEIRSNIFETYTGLGYTLELNDRDDSTFPTRHSVYFFANRDLTDVWQSELTGRYRYGDYKDISRNDNRLWFSLKFSRSIPWQFRIYGKYDFIRNYSNADENDYTSNIFSIGIERFF